MKNMTTRIVAGLLATIGFSLVETNLSAASRPISDFLARQGKFCFRLDTSGNVDCGASGYVADTTGGGCFLFVPPAANYSGWSDPKGTSASFDYAGLADAALGGRLGTTMDGSIEETPQPDGSAIVKVELHTVNALAFAVDGFDFNGPLLFGNRVSDVLGGAPASLGSCTLRLIFRNSAPGAALPDIEDLFFCHWSDVIFVSFVGQAQGLLHNGQPGMLQVTQTGVLQAQANPHSRVALDGFPAEHVLIRATGN
jgi:hypothetical protein